MDSSVSPAQVPLVPDRVVARTCRGTSTPIWALEGPGSDPKGEIVDGWEWVRRLTELIPPPGGRFGYGWDAVQERLGTVLPTDYKRLVETYGPGSFDDFLSVLTPHAPTEYVDILRVGSVDRWALREVVRCGMELPERVGSVDRLVTWGVTDNGDRCYWVTGACPESWAVAVNDGRASEWEFFEMSVTELLYRVLSRKLVVTIFPEDFPDDRPEFFRFDVNTSSPRPPSSGG